MKSLKEALATAGETSSPISSSETEFDPFADLVSQSDTTKGKRLPEIEVCPLHHEEDGCCYRHALSEYEGQHECWTCCDGGFLRVTADKNHPDFGKVQPCPSCANAASEPEERVEERIHIPKAYAGATLENLTQAQRQAVEGLIATPYQTKPILVLTGNAGTGKTYAACVALKEFRRQHRKHARFWPTVDLLEEYRRSYDQDRAERTTESIDAELRQAWVLCIDDFGKHKSTEWADQQLYRLINHRWSERKPLIVTTNMAPEDFDPAIKSRLFGSEHAAVVRFEGKDRRFS